MTTSTHDLIDLGGGEAGARMNGAATIHRIAGGHHHGGPDFTMSAEFSAKLDRVLEGQAALQVGMATVTTRMDGVLDTAVRHEREMEESRLRHARDVEALSLRITALERLSERIPVLAGVVDGQALDVKELKARPAGFTWRQVLAAGGGLAALVLVSIQLFQMAVRAAG